MFPTRHELLAQFSASSIVPHPRYNGFESFANLAQWMPQGAVLELPKLKIVVHAVDYLRNMTMPVGSNDTLLRFQQDSYRLWYQVDGQGIIQNATRSTFGNSRPGHLGVMDHGERHTYMHQRGAFECFMMDFSLHPSQQAKCYWNSEVEGKIILTENEKLYFENLVFDCIHVITSKREMLGLASVSRILEILVVLFKKGILVIEESQFPKNKQKSLVAKAKNFIKMNYSSLHHQQALAKECGVDINYLNIIFVKETGKTLYKFLTDVRMEHAKYLLEETQTAISDIAGSIGYPNANSFTRAFRLYAKQTPGDYRKKNSFSKEKKSGTTLAIEPSIIPAGEPS
jgi:AraC-like DNA-binding protein